LRAVVLGDTPWSLRVADGWPEPGLGSGQLMVRVHGVGICGSDLALISHARRAPAYPWVLGHEAFGEVVAAGDAADPARIGQRVVIEPNYPCLDCPACRAGLTSMCPNRVLVGFTHRGCSPSTPPCPRHTPGLFPATGRTATRSAPSR